MKKHSIEFSVWHADANTITNKVKPVAGTTRNPMVTNEISHNFEISRSEVGHLEQVSSTARQKSSRQPGDDMPDIDIDAMIWGICMSATMNAAVHLVQDYQENPRTTKNTDFEKSHTVVRYFAKIDTESEG